MLGFNNLFTIGEVSKIKNISIDALRHYDKIGLLKPEYVDEQTKYRYYGESQFFLIELIQCCKSLEIPLSQMKELLKNSNQEFFTSFLMQQKAHINSKINEYSQMLVLIDNISNQVADYNRSKKETGTYLKCLPQRNVVYAKLSEPHSGTDRRFTYSRLYNSIAKANLHVSYSGGVIHAVDNEKITAKLMFESVNESPFDTALPTMALPCGYYLCITYCEGEFDERLAILRKEMASNKISSAYIIDTYFLDGEFHSKNSLHEIQVFVS